MFTSATRTVAAQSKASRFASSGRRLDRAEEVGLGPWISPTREGWRRVWIWLPTAAGNFIDEGLWSKALAARGRYYLIQFGHNDEPGKGPERETDPKTTYRTFMAKYVDESRAIGATPILVTSLVRRIYNPDGTIKTTQTPYVEAVRALAAEARPARRSSRDEPGGCRKRRRRRQADLSPRDDKAGGSHAPERERQRRGRPHGRGRIAPVLPELAVFFRVGPSGHPKAETSPGASIGLLITISVCHRGHTLILPPRRLHKFISGHELRRPATSRQRAPPLLRTPHRVEGGPAMPLKKSARSKTTAASKCRRRLERVRRSRERRHGLLVWERCSWPPCASRCGDCHCGARTDTRASSRIERS